ncbi:MAG: hypothetical protein V4613_14445 [Bacteroidota bacterium]
MKKILFSLSLLFSLFLSAEASVNKASSGATDACAEAITNSIFALNNLTESQYCELYTIMHNTTTTNTQKWTAVSSNSNLTTYYNTLNASSATLQANNFNTLSASDVILVKNEVKENLMGIPNVNPACVGYYTRCGEILDQNWDCLIAAGSSLYGGNIGAFTAALAACDAILVRNWLKNQIDNPGCGPFFSAFVPKNYIFEFTATETTCSE